MEFSHALALVKNGMRMKRHAWPGWFIKLKPALGPNSAYIEMDGKHTGFSYWQITQDDVLSEDWETLC
jgi:hypothetical protein